VPVKTRERQKYALPVCHESGIENLFQKIWQGVMQKLALLIAAGIVCVFVSAPYILAADIQRYPTLEWSSLTTAYPFNNAAAWQ
jgi:hypothetical protein